MSTCVTCLRVEDEEVMKKTCPSQIYHFFEIMMDKFFHDFSILPSHGQNMHSWRHPCFHSTFIKFSEMSSQAKVRLIFRI